jgi:glycosyltransferase involved in cell wall biosynthesis
VKILMAHKFYYYSGGADKYFFDLKELMKSQGHDVVPFAMRHPRNLETQYSDYFVSAWDPNAKGLRARVSNAARMVHSFEAARAMRRLIADTGPDLAHLHHIYHQLSSSILYPLADAGVPIVQTVHDYKLVCPNYKLFNPRTGLPCDRCMGHAYYHAIFERCLQDSALAGAAGCIEAYWTLLSRVYKSKVARFTVSNDHLKGKLLSYGISPDRIEIIPNFIDLEAYEPKYGSEGYVLYFGRISTEKGILTLIEAMERLESLPLKIVGDGPQLSTLQAYVEERSLDNIHFLGPAWDEDLKPILAGAMFVVVPPIWPENSPFVIYQSFAAGKPVIGSRVGGIPDLIDDGKNGLLFEAQDVRGLADKIEYLASRPDLAVEMGRAAREKTEREYDPQVHYQRMMAIYEDVLSAS